MGERLIKYYKYVHDELGINGKFDLANKTKIPSIFVLSPTGQIEHSFTGIPEGVTADQFLEKLIYSPKETSTDSTVADPTASSQATANKNESTTAKQANKQSVQTSNQANKQSTSTAKQAQTASNKQKKQASTQKKVTPTKKVTPAKDTVKKEPVIIKAYDPNQSLTPDW